MKIWNILKKTTFLLLVGAILISIYFFIESIKTNSTSFFDSLINGIISGIVTAIIIFIFQIIWKKNILIWIENLLYQDVCIEGDWSGFIVPHFGLQEIDEIQKNHAWRSFKKAIERRENLNNEELKDEPNEITTASIINSETGEEEEISAEVIVHTSKNGETQEESKINDKKRRLNISPKPIIVKAELNRKGHQITGRVIETGGASDVHTYNINGSFKNLILTATYESSSKDNIDRGALSLMLLRNGEILEGFFSSYGDNNHRITPMKCIFTKRNQVNDNKI